MLRITRVGVTGVLAIVLACGVAGGARAASIAVTDSCTYAGGQFAVVGNGFAPNQPVTVEIMPTADPSAGPSSQSAVATASARGDVLAIFDVPAGTGSPAVLRSVRARTPGDTNATAASVLAAAPLRIASRSVTASGDGSTAGAIQRWRVTGLPHGTRLYAHFRHARRTVASRFLGVAADPCGQLSFDLRTLPRGFGRRGDWDLWMTTRRSFRGPPKGIHVHRRLTAAGPRSGSRVSAGTTTSRLAPLDQRLTSPVTHRMAADSSQIGLLTLWALGMAPPVSFLERVDDRLTLLGTGVPVAADEPLARLRDAARWSCDRRDRHFVATGTRPGGGLALASFSVRTPSCARRFELGTPRRIGVGRVVRVRIVDRWALGAITPSLCVTAPGKRRECRRVALAAGVHVAARRFRATAPGRWRVRLRLRERRVASAVVRAGEGAVAKAPPKLLATGDSTMQGLDAFLGDELGDAVALVSDVRIGSGISRPAAAPGGLAPGEFAAELARAQTTRLRQRTTVVSLGAAEGFDMTTPDGTRVACCDGRWVAEYARRVRVLMQIYARNGRGRVLWLTIPLPQVERRLASVRAVNAAIVAAAAGLPQVSVIPLDAVFTPDGYRDVIRYRGRDVAVRDIDGVHLNVAGTAIAARIVARALRGG